MKEKGISPEMSEKYEDMGASDSMLGTVESAYTSRSMLSQVMLRKKEQMRRMKEEELRRNS
jgi:hypothetical protein